MAESKERHREKGITAKFTKNDMQNVHKKFEPIAEAFEEFREQLPGFLPSEKLSITSRTDRARLPS